MDGIKDDHLLEDFVKRQIEKSEEIQAILTKPSLAQVNQIQTQPQIQMNFLGWCENITSVHSKLITEFFNEFYSQ